MCRFSSKAIEEGPLICQCCGRSIENFRQMTPADTLLISPDYPLESISSGLSGDVTGFHFKGLKSSGLEIKKLADG